MNINSTHFARVDHESVLRNTAITHAAARTINQFCSPVWDPYPLRETKVLAASLLTANRRKSRRAKSRCARALFENRRTQSVSRGDQKRALNATAAAVSSHRRAGHYFDDRLAEMRQIIRLATRNEVAIDHDRRVLPNRACVHKI